MGRAVRHLKVGWSPPERAVYVRYSLSMEIARFLSRFPPFDSLTSDELEELERHLQIEFFPAHTTILRQTGEPADFLYVVRKGAVDLVAQGEVFDQLLEGECFGHPSLLSGLGPAFSVTTSEDTLCYLLDRAEAERLLGTRAGLTFLAQSLRRRTSRVFEGQARAALDRSTTSVGSLLRRRPVACDGSTSVRSAAETMRRERVSSILIPKDGAWGIVTDRDLRTRVIAPGRDLETPVAELMSFPARAIDAEATVAEVLLLMLDDGIHHLPVVGTGHELLGVVTDTDLMGLELQTPFAIRNAIDRADADRDAIAAAGGLRGAVCSLVDASVDPIGIGHTITTTIDALARRLIQLAIHDLGDPPVPWAWLALGSQARREQGLKTDQDHAIAFEASGREVDEVDPYFAALAQRVTDGLELAGIPRCRGGVMAERPEWRLPRSEWVSRFSSWVDRSDPGARVFTAIAFDYRRIEGSLDIEADVDPLIRMASRRSFAVKRMGRTAIDQRPPTGFLGHLITRPGGERSSGLDIKRGGITTIVSLARTLAVSAGVSANATITRLDASRGSDLIDDELRTGLTEAFRFLWQVRVEHQARQVEAGAEPDDLVDPAILGPLTRQGLKDAFRMIGRGQAALARALDFRAT
jgi:CBS domain-containing protein